jgi:hypothetical protein
MSDGALTAGRSARAQFVLEVLEVDDEGIGTARPFVTLAKVCDP